MRNLLTISLLLFALTAFSQQVSLQRIQEEEHPVYKEVIDNSEYAKLWRELTEAKHYDNVTLFNQLNQEMKNKFPEKLSAPSLVSAPFVACGGETQPPFNSDWGNYNVRVFNGNIYSGGTNTESGGNPRTLRMKSDSAGIRYCAFINATRDTFFVYKGTGNAITSWTSIQRLKATSGFFHSFDFYVTDSANVTKLGFAISLTTTTSTTDGQLYFQLMNGDGSLGRLSQIQATPSGRGLINPAVMTDGSQHPAGTTAWYFTYSSYSPSTPTANDALTAITMDWGATFALSAARTTFNDYDLDIDYISYPTGDTVYVVLANNLTPTNANLRIRKIPLSAYPAGAWTQVNPAGSANPEFGSQLTVNRLTGQMICTFSVTVSGTNTSSYNYTTPNGPSFNTTSYYNLPTEPSGSLFPMCDINPWDSTFRVSYLTPAGLAYCSSKIPANGFVKDNQPINFVTPSLNIAPDINDYRGSISFGGPYWATMVYSGTGNANVNYNGQDLLQVGVQGNGNIAKDYTLSQNYPNPFNPATNIKYSIPVNGFVTLKVYNILGNEVASLVNANQIAGEYSVDFNTSSLNLASGVYFYKLTTDNFTDVKKMSLIK